IGIGRENTRQLGSFLKQEKEYLAEIKLGATSTTDDSGGEIVEVETITTPRLQDIELIIPEFTGEIWQTPPFYSAVKIDGVRAYKRIREGEDFEIKPRKREVKSIEITHYSWPLLTIKV